MNKKRLIINGLCEVKKRIEKRNKWREKMLDNGTFDTEEDKHKTQRIHKRKQRQVRYLGNLIERYQSLTGEEIQKDMLLPDEEFESLNFKDV